MSGRWYWRATRLQHALTQGASDAKRILRNPIISSTIRRSLAQTAFRLAMAEHTGLTNPIRIAGYKVSYLRREPLEYLYREVFVDTCYNFRCSTPEPVILDCGSNIGMAMLFFKKIHPKAQITCFEPDPRTFAVLSKNVSQNRLSGIDLHCCALTGVDGETSFYHSDEEVGSLLMSTHSERLSGTQIQVPSRALSSFIKTDVDLLKLDIEGAEYPVLLEVAEAGKLRQIRHMHIEYHHHIGSDGDTLSATLSLLEREGFGYQIGADSSQLSNLGGFQDIALHAYRKD